MKKKILAAVLACALCVGIGVGGTLAWLTATTDDVTNTFTTSDIDITLAETTENYKMVPGHAIDKDPKVTVSEGSEPCFLFVKIEKSTNAAFDDYMTYEIADGWTPLSGVDGVYYRTVENSAGDRGVLSSDKEFDVLKDNKVEVKDSVTKSMMNALTDTTQPTLTFTAFATQMYKDNAGTDADVFTPADAWAKVQPAPSST